MQSPGNRLALTYMYDELRLPRLTPQAASEPHASALRMSGLDDGLRRPPPPGPGLVGEPCGERCDVYEAALSGDE